MTARILVVEREEPMREIIISMLTTAGYLCQEAQSGEEALALLDSDKQFDLVLSEVMLVRLDGIQMMERMTQKYPNVRVVFVSSVHDNSVALAAIRSGAYDYLRKPFDRDQLIDTVRRALEKN